MVSSITFALIHSRLSELFPETNNSFGNQNMLIFGDLLQVSRNKFLLFDELCLNCNEINLF